MAGSAGRVGAAPPSEHGRGLALSIIVVNWNTRDLLADCLRSVYDTVRDLSFEVFVVDNASSDGSAVMVRERFPMVRLIENPDNAGFARANNQALAEACGEYLLLLNPDTVAMPGALHRLVSFLKAMPEYGIVGAQLLNADGSLQESWGRYPGVLTELPLLNRFPARGRRGCLLPDAGLALRYLEVPWVSGAALVLRREVFDALGGLDEAFWLYTEETDYCYRAYRAGHKVASLCDAQIIHLRRRASGQRMVSSMLWFYQSKVRFVAKHRGVAAAGLVKRIVRLKAAQWQRKPDASPLRVAYADVPAESIVLAYRALGAEFARPLGELLARAW